MVKLLALKGYGGSATPTKQWQLWLQKLTPSSALQVSSLVLLIIFLTMPYSFTAKSNNSHRDSSSKQLSILEMRLQQQQNSNKKSLCDGYDGILYISKGSRKADAATLFFQSMVDLLLYADLYNLYPWIHLSGDNPCCYDGNFHTNQKNITIKQMSGTVQNTKAIGAMECTATSDGTYPGSPDFHYRLSKKSFRIQKGDIWSTYFQRIAPFPAACNNLPIFELSEKQIMPDLHRCSDIAVRAWPFKGLPKQLMPRSSIKEWLWEQSREPGSRTVQKYIRPLPWIQELVLERLSQQHNGARCCAIHLQLQNKQSDKIDLGVQYAQAFVRAAAEHGFSLLVSTANPDEYDQFSTKLVDALPLGYPISLLPLVSLEHQKLKHDRNVQTLVNIYSMSHCQWLIHDYSTTAEAVVYLQPSLHHQSINIDDSDGRMPLNDFEQMVQERVSLAGG